MRSLQLCLPARPQHKQAVHRAQINKRTHTLELPSHRHQHHQHQPAAAAAPASAATSTANISCSINSAHTHTHTTRLNSASAQTHTHTHPTHIQPVGIINDIFITRHGRRRGALRRGVRAVRADRKVSTNTSPQTENALNWKVGKTRAHKHIHAHTGTSTHLDGFVCVQRTYICGRKLASMCGANKSD